MKKVQVSMSDHDHAVLKDYANAFGMTMSEVLYEASRHHIHKHSRCCGLISALFEFKKVVRDKRLEKDCYGHSCFACNHSTACRTGLYKGSWEMDPQVQQYIDMHQTQNKVNAEIPLRP